nr:IS30 family transposase [Mucispirillum sp.]
MNTTVKSKKNKQLTSSECYKLEGLLKAKVKVSEIAKILNRNKSTIYREIKQGKVSFRNSDWSIRQEYSAYHSLNVRQASMSKTGRKLLYTEMSPDLLSYIQNKLDYKYSPDAVSGELKKAGIYTICTQTIYNYISVGILNSAVYKRHTRKAANKARIAYNNTRGRSIEEHPFEVKERIYGKREMDTVLGKQGSKAALLVLKERVSRFEIIIKLKDKTQKSIISALDKLEKEYKDKFSLIFKSITVDNGIEFLDMAGLEKSVYNKLSKRTTIYYAHPYCSPRKG